MQSPSSRKRPRLRTVRVLGKQYTDTDYKPQFALGFLCTDEHEQRTLHRTLTRQLPGKEIKALVI